METRKNGLWLGALLAIAAVSACGEDEDDPIPSGPSLPLDSSVPIDGSLSNPPDAALDAGAPTGECRGQNDCFSCKPTTNLELLNACASGCVPFDNAKRLPSFRPGQLPPL